MSNVGPLSSLGVADPVSPNPFVTNFPVVDSTRTGNAIIIAGFSLPGKWTLLNALKDYGWDQRAGYGQDGAYVVSTGTKLVTARFLGEFWANSDVFVFKTFRSAFLKSPVIAANGQVANLPSLALGIAHPELAALGVTSVVVKSIGPLLQMEPGLWSIEIDFLQYRPPKLTVARPLQTTPPGPKSPANAPTAAQVELQQSQATASQLASQVGRQASALTGPG
jgi:hypothetical protein